MILHRLRILNFRQFYGDHSMRFALDGERNVTVFLGENGSGKSTLLYAMAWCLHGPEALKDRLKNPDRLLNYRALEACKAGETEEVIVELEFQHDSKLYRVTRRFSYLKAGAGTPPRLKSQVLEVRAKDSPEEPGAGTVISNQQDQLDRIMPTNLLPFFFFAGEEAGAWVDPRQAKQLKEAVANVLDVAVLEKAAKHCKTVRTQLGGDLRDLAVGDGADLETKIGELEEERSSLEADITKQEAELSALGKKRLSNDKALEKFKETQPLIQEKGELETRKQGLDDLLEEKRAGLTELIGRSGYLALLGESLRKTSELLNDAYRRDDLPARIKPGFVDELLKNAKCICGSALDEDSSYRTTLLQFRNSSGLDVVAEPLQVLQGRVRAIPRSDSFRDSFSEKHLSYLETLAKLTKAQERSFAIEKELEGKYSSEDQLDGLLAERRSVGDEIWRVENLLRTLRDRLGHEDSPLTVLGELHLKEDDRRKLHRGNKDAKRLSRQAEALGHVEQAIRRLHEGWLSVVQRYLDSQIQAVYNDVGVLERQISFDENFRLSMRELADGRFVESDASGANQGVLALCFIASMVELAYRVSLQQSGSADPISTNRYPMVMDAPFAKMDDHFRTTVPNYLSRVVPQIIIINSVGQWRGQVEEGLRSRVGQAYLLHLHTSGGETRTVDFLGRSVDYVVNDATADPDFSLIEELET
jgi:DNA sulfur modification protein DndD